MDYSEFKRESANRHQSEKLLDRDIIKFERKQNIEYFEREIQKKVKLEEEQKKAQEEKLKQIKSLDIKCHEALDKILKHFTNPTKCSKALHLAKETLIKNLDSLELDHVFYALFEILKHFKNFETADDKKNIKELFEYLETKSFIFNNPRKKALYEVWKIEGLYHSAIFTDDSYKFNNAVKKIKELIESLETPIDLPLEAEIVVVKPELEKKEAVESESKSLVLNSIRNKLVKKNPQPTLSETEPKKEEIEEKKVEENPKKYEYVLSKEIIEYMADEKNYNNLKKEILFEAIRDLFKMYKLIWAKATVKQFFDDIFYKSHRDLFNPDQIRGIEDLKANLQSMKLNDSSKGFKREVLDSGIVSNPLNSQHEVKDGRSTTFTFDGVGKWANKQVGL